MAGTRGRRVGIFQKEGQLWRVFLPQCRGGLWAVGLSTAGPSPASTGHTAGSAVLAEAVVSRAAPFTLLGCTYLAISFFKYAITCPFKRSWKKTHIFNTNANHSTSCVCLAAAFLGSFADASVLNLPSPPTAVSWALVLAPALCQVFWRPPGFHPVLI